MKLHPVVLPQAADPASTATVHTGAEHEPVQRHCGSPLPVWQVVCVVAFVAGQAFVCWQAVALDHVHCWSPPEPATWQVARLVAWAGQRPVAVFTAQEPVNEHPDCVAQYPASTAVPVGQAGAEHEPVHVQSGSPPPRIVEQFEAVAVFTVGHWFVKLQFGTNWQTEADAPAFVHAERLVFAPQAAPL